MNVREIEYKFVTIQKQKQRLDEFDGMHLYISFNIFMTARCFCCLFKLDLLIMNLTLAQKKMYINKSAC